MCVLSVLCCCCCCTSAMPNKLLIIILWSFSSLLFFWETQILSLFLFFLKQQQKTRIYFPSSFTVLQYNQQLKQCFFFDQTNLFNFNDTTAVYRANTTSSFSSSSFLFTTALTEKERSKKKITHTHTSFDYFLNKNPSFWRQKKRLHFSPLLFCFNERNV